MDEQWWLVDFYGQWEELTWATEGEMIDIFGEDKFRSCNQNLPAPTQERIDTRAKGLIDMTAGAMMDSATASY